MTALAAAALARAKRGVRAAVALAGGVEQAGFATVRCKSTCGRWNALNEPDLPPLDAALALDEIAVAQGHLPAITAFLARELGGVFLPLPADPNGDGELLRRAGAVAEGSGALIAGLAADLADGLITPIEAARRIADADALVAVAGGIAKRLREIAGESER